MKTTSEVLNRAADLIEERGWTRGTKGVDPSFPEGACLMGAIGATIGAKVYAAGTGADHPSYGYHEVDTCAASGAVRKYLEMPTGARLYSWNDTPRRTASEVVEVLRAAAVIEAAKESRREPVSATS